MAQDIALFFSPSMHVGQLSFENMTSPKTDVKGDGEKSKITNSRFDAQYTKRGDSYDYLFGLNYRHFDLDHGKGNRDFFQYQGSIGIKKNLADNRFWLTTLSYGTASDRPFKNADDDTITINYVQKTSDKWFFVINYSNNRAFLNNIPFPGFFYMKDVSREKTTIFGLPFFLFIRQYGDWSVKYLGFLPWTHQARLSFTKFFWIRPYVGFEQGVISFFRHDREELKDRVFFFQRKVGTGLEVFLSKSLRVDTSFGHVFDREIFEAKNFSEKKKGSTRFDASLYLEMKLVYTF